MSTKHSGGGDCGASQFEVLEPRLLLSGNVLAYTAAGNLYIVGDAEANDVVVTVQGAGSFEVKSGTTSATTINDGSDPVDLADVTGSVYALLGTGDDMLEFTLKLLTPVPGTGLGDAIPPNIYGDLYVDMGPGNNSFAIGSGGEIIAGNMTVVAGPGSNAISAESMIVDGGILILTGPGIADISLSGVTAASLFVSNLGTPSVPEGVGALGAGYATGVSITGGTYISGNVTILDGLGNDYVSFDNATVLGNTYVNSGPDGLYADVDDCEFDGSLLIYKGEGGSVQGYDVSGNTNGTDPYPVAGYTSVEDTSIGTTFISHGASGYDQVFLDGVTVGNLPKGVGLPDAPAGFMFIDTEWGSSFIYMNDVAVNGPTLVKQEGGFDADTYSIAGGETTTALIIGPFTTDNVGNGAINEFYGDFTLINGPGTDLFALKSVHVWGNLLALNGPGAAAFGIFQSYFEGAVTWVRGDGGSLPSIPTYFTPNQGTSVGFVLEDASSYVTIQNAWVYGPMTILNGAGYNYAEITGLMLNGIPAGEPQAPTVNMGNLLVVNGWGRAEFLMDSSTVSGWVTIVDVGGPNSIPALPTFYNVTDTEIGNVNTGLGIDGHNVDIGGDLTLLTGPGGDETHVRDTWVGGNMFVSNGPDAAIVTLEQGSLIDGSLTVLRGDAAALAVSTGVDPALGTFYATAGEDEVSSSSVVGPTLLINGAGSTTVTLTTGTGEMTGDVNVFNGAGYQYFVLGGTFGGNVNLYGGASIPLPVIGLGDITTGCTVAVGGSSLPVQIAGNLFLQTGAYDDRVTFFNATIAGTTTVDTGLGDDTVAVDDSTFTGAVGLTTGPEFAAGLSDADTVNIERTESTATGTTFTSALTIKTGDDDDAVYIGLEDQTSGLGDESNECFATFTVDSSVDGGAGDDTLDYLTGGNVFLNDAVLTDINVETVV